MKIEVQEINKFSVWDDFLYRQCPWNYFQLWDYGEVQKLLGVKVLRIGLIKNKEMIGQSQIFIVRAKRGNFLQIKHGPVLTIKATKNDVLFYLKKLKRIAGENGCLFIRINPLVEGKKSIFWQRLGFLPSPIHNMDAEICLKIDLLQNEEKILSLMRKTNRNLIRKARKLGVVVCKGAGKIQLTLFLKLFYKSANRKGFITHRGIEEEFNIFKKRKKVLIFLSKYGKDVLSGAFVTFTRNQAVYRHGGTADILTNIPASYLLQWEIIKEAKRRKMKIYNLWGITKESDKSHPWHGFTQFKKGFGGEVYEYLHSMDLPLSKKYCFTRFIELSIKVVRGYQKVLFFRSPYWLRGLFGV